MTRSRILAAAAIVATVVLGAQTWHKAFRPGAHPRFDTVLKVMKALGVKMTAVPAEHGPQPG